MERIKKIVMVHKEVDSISSIADVYKIARDLFIEKYPEFYNHAIGNESGLKIVSEMNLSKKPWNVYMESGGGNTKTQDRKINLQKCRIVVQMSFDNSLKTTLKLGLVIYYKEKKINNVQTFYLGIGQRQSDGLYVFDYSYFEKDCIRKGEGIEVSRYLNCDSVDFPSSIKSFCQKTVRILNKELAK